MKELLPAIQSTADEVCVFQEDNALAHCVRQTLELLCHETLAHCVRQTLGLLCHETPELFASDISK